MWSKLFSKNRQASQAFILFTVFLDVLGIGLIIPVLPSLVGEFTASRDQQAYWYGALSVTYGVMQFFCAPMLGALSDRFGRRPVLLLSIFGLAVSYVVHAVAASLLSLLLVRILSGGTGASFSVANAYMADITSTEQRGKSFGLLGAAFGMGFIFGPMLGGVLGAYDLRLPFVVAAVLALLNGLYGYFVLPESLPVERRAAFSFQRANPFSALGNLSRIHGVGGLIWVFALTVLAQFILQTTWVLYTEFRFGWGPPENGAALFVVGMVGALVQGLLQGRLLKRFGEVRLALFGLASGTVAFLLYGLATQGWMLYCIVLANFLSFAAGPALQAIVSKSVDPSEQGLTMGSLNAINSVAIIVAPVIGSSLLAEVSHLPGNDWRLGATFYICSVLQGLGLLLAVLHFNRQARQRRVPAGDTVPSVDLPASHS
ncbi:TCR/Tet family MFS transporter [Chitinimonas arctica]|uniref:TCR/Tet family MFS transporter n=1 Tax=Chitinimonas arctica TaxID=2594795 RepID=A0A516SDF4_9NEIS|nr:TCR/Tet family MFS transporter [Chitinimonas arctica]QDQ26187.1 TCR/Tet family MFS transporter [Chitinimonas arctica]